MSRQCNAVVISLMFYLIHPLSVLHDGRLPLRGMLLGQAFYLVSAITANFTTQPCIVVFGKTKTGKSSFINVQCWFGLPKTDEEYVDCVEGIKR